VARQVPSPDGQGRREEPQGTAWDTGARDAVAPRVFSHGISRPAAHHCRQIFLEHAALTAPGKGLWMLEPIDRCLCRTRRSPTTPAADSLHGGRDREWTVAYRRKQRADLAHRRTTRHLVAIASKEIYMQTIGTNDLISSDKVEGTTVYNLEGDKLGSVDELIIDKLSGHVRYAVLEFGGFLGMGTDRYPMPWSILKYDTVKEGYVVPLDKARIESAPRYPDSDTPAYTQEYGRKVNGYYGVDY